MKLVETLPKFVYMEMDTYYLLFPSLVSLVIGIVILPVTQGSVTPTLCSCLSDYILSVQSLRCPHTLERSPPLSWELCYSGSLLTGLGSSQLCTTLLFMHSWQSA